MPRRIRPERSLDDVWIPPSLKLPGQAPSSTLQHVLSADVPVVLPFVAPFRGPAYFLLCVVTAPEVSLGVALRMLQQVLLRCVVVLVHAAVAWPADD